MNTIQSLVPLLVLITLIPAVYAAYIKASARLLRYQGITWKQSFAFGLIIIICGLSLRAATFFTGYSIQSNLSFLLGLPIHILLGGWFFSKRGSKPSKESLGWGGAILLTSIAVFLISITMVAFFNVFKRF